LRAAGVLFDIPFVSLLDPVLYTLQNVYERDPFLFIAVLAISSGYFPSRPGLYQVAMHFAKHAAATAFADSVKVLRWPRPIYS